MNWRCFHFTEGKTDNHVIYVIYITGKLLRRTVVSVQEVFTFFGLSQDAFAISDRFLVEQC